MTDRAWQNGFTLIETLAALGVVAAMSAIVLPGLASGLDRSGLYGARISFAAEVQALRRRAFREARPLTLGVSSEAPLIALDDGWRYELSAPLHIDAAGRCNGGAVRLVNRRGLSTTLRLSAPDCAEVR